MNKPYKSKEDYEVWSAKEKEFWGETADTSPTTYANKVAREAVDEISEYLRPFMDDGAILGYNLALGCRCLSCYSWQIVTDENVRDPKDFETLWDIVMWVKSQKETPV